MRKQNGYKFWTLDEVKELIIEKPTVSNAQHLARKLGRTVMSVLTFYNLYNHWKDGSRTKRMKQDPRFGANIFSLMEQAHEALHIPQGGFDRQGDSPLHGVDVVPERVGSKPVETEEPTEVTNQKERNLLRLEKAFDAFQAELITVIDSEARRRAEKEVTDLKEEYEEKLKKMQTVMESAKESNFAGTLRKAWQGL